ncbi:MAG TPA: ABC transporter substrate-binding protein, partial [Myxococcaceae bacterium]|nr:ABC transporter substrate-binding protein [Myxococcaceae bacterium]
MRELTRMCKVRLGVGLGLLLMVPSACGGDAEPTIRIGTVLTTSGDLAEVGNDELEAASLAVDEINAQGGVLDQQLELIHRDDGLDVARGQAAAQALIDLKATVILGSVASSITLAVSEVTTASRVVQISAGSTSALISKAKDDGFLFRTCPSDALQAKVIAKRARAKGVSKIAVIYVPNTYGESLKDVFEQEFQAGGGTITYKRSYAEGQISYAGQLTELFATGPEAVLLIGYPVDGAQVINDYVASFASEGTFWYFSDGLFNNTFVTAVGASNFTFPHE